ncbi:hypothetical protein NUW54_g4910 [Trametes sanguinea]|uniref:Uncharacterized protein n=1 Tax=Trametes sanguinea TaxID=158606 RepID=A0ACC1PZC2_9APHY|nr:hypothetical protein NUW54_g4910 [Trametes sanguinea]
MDRRRAVASRVVVAMKSVTVSLDFRVFLRLLPLLLLLSSLAPTLVHSPPSQPPAAAAAAAATSPAPYPLLNDAPRPPRPALARLLPARLPLVPARARAPCDALPPARPASRALPTTSVATRAAGDAPRGGRAVRRGRGGAVRRPAGFERVQVPALLLVAGGRALFGTSRDAVAAGAAHHHLDGKFPILVIMRVQLEDARDERARWVASHGEGKFEKNYWTLENYISNITHEIKQHVTPYANVSECALRHCQVNATIAMFLSLAPPEMSSTVSPTDLGEEYALLHPKDCTPTPLSDSSEDLALCTYLRAHGGIEIKAPLLCITRWGHLQIPTGQIARTVMVKLRDGRLAEVCYFFIGSALNEVFSLAMVSLFSAPDQDILCSSLGVVRACSYQSTSSRMVINVKDIVAVIAMVPLSMTRDEEQATSAADRYATQFFLVEKPGLEIVYLSGSIESDELDVADM